MRIAESIIPSRSALGEGPIWDDQRQEIFWVDILGKMVHRADENGQNHKTFLTPDYVSNIFLTENGNDLILCLPDAYYLWNLDTEKLDKWVDMPDYDPGVRTNDGFCDVHGNLWIGTMALSEKPDLGKLYVLDNNKKWHVMLDEVSVSNGIRCLPDGETFYYIDTPTQLVREYRFDPETITWEFIRNVIEIPTDMGYPDGMSMDEEGRLWVSLWNGYGIVCVDPVTGKIVERIDVPAPQVSANIFGGKDSNQLFITTARKSLSNNKLEEYPLTGDLFHVSMDVKGGETYRRKV